jgi:hypothetical protein
MYVNLISDILNISIHVFFTKLFTDYLVRWFDLSHDNLVPLLGISMDFGRFPAIVTSWMTNGMHELWQQSIRLSGT